MQRAQERLYLTAEKDRLVGYGHPKAAFLFASEGDEIPDSAVAKFGLKDGRLGGRPTPRPAETLIGSSKLPNVVEITDKITAALGAIVMRAHKESGLDVAAWNKLPDDDREERLAVTIEAMKAEAASPSTSKPEVRPTSKPEVRPTPKPRAAAKKAAPKKK